MLGFVVSKGHWNIPSAFGMVQPIMLRVWPASDNPCKEIKGERVGVRKQGSSGLIEARSFVWQVGGEKKERMESRSRQRKACLSGERMLPTTSQEVIHPL